MPARARARASATGRDRIDRQEPRGPRHLGAHGDECGERPGARKARVLGRRQHPFDRGRGVGCHASFPERTRHRLRHGCRGDARARHARVLRLPAHQSRRRRMGARGQAEMGALEHARLSVRRGRHRRAVRRGHRRRRPHPADAHRRSERAVEGASAGAAAHDPPRADGNRRHVLPDHAGGPLRRLRRLHAEDQAAAAGPRSQPEFPRELETGVRAARRRTLSDIRAGDPRDRRLHRPASEHHRGHDVPHVERRAAASVRAHAGRRDGRRGPVVLPARRPQRHRAHRVSGDLRLSRVPLSTRNR